LFVCLSLFVCLFVLFVLSCLACLVLSCLFVCLFVCLFRLFVWSIRLKDMSISSHLLATYWKVAAYHFSNADSSLSFLNIGTSRYKKDYQAYGIDRLKNNASGLGIKGWPIINITRQEQKNGPPSGRNPFQRFLRREARGPFLPLKHRDSKKPLIGEAGRPKKKRPPEETPPKRGTPGAPLGKPWKTLLYTGKAPEWATKGGPV